MSEAPEVNPTPAKSPEAHPLDTVTGGAFSAETSGDRAARLREWLATAPALDVLQDVFKEMNVRDKGAARVVRDRLDELRRAKDQDAIAVEWVAKAQALLAQPTLNTADAAAWQREAAKAGAPLSREPLAGYKAQLAERIKAAEDLQHRVQVQKEAAVLLSQRIEVLSTKSWKDAAAVQQALSTDVARWQEQAQALTEDAAWASLDARLAQQLTGSRDQLNVVWEAFSSALAATQAAADNAEAALPTVPVWADEIRVGRGLPAELAAETPAAQPAKGDAPIKAAAVVLQAAQALQALLEGSEDKTGAIAGLRAALRQHGRSLDAAVLAQMDALLVQAGDARGWKPQAVDAEREALVAKAKALLERPEGQSLGGRKVQESLRQLREQWKQLDQGSAPNHGLWKQFDEACNTAYKVVEGWLDKLRSESAEHKASRTALIEELRAWGQSVKDSQDWKGMARSLRQFAERWREGGHVGEKLYAELQQQWRQAMGEAEAPLQRVQQASLQRRHAMIEEAQALGNAPALQIAAIKALQQRWQAEAQEVPVDRRQEQKLWDAFRKPLDEAFSRKPAERGDRARTAVNPATLSAHDRAVLEASQQLEAANADGDVQKIRAAVAGLEEVLRNAPAAAAAEAASPSAAEGEAAPAAPAVARPIKAVRGDDRPGMRKEAAPAPAARKPGRPERGDRGDRFERPDRTPRGPRLGDAAFRAQREAMDHAQFALRKLTAQAHGEALTQLMDAWGQRDAALLPAAQELGKLSNATRNSWQAAVSGAAQGDAAQSLLRLEMAADVPTPADQLSARRALQLQLLTNRKAADPRTTWEQDVAAVLAAARSDSDAQRLQSALKALLRGSK
ncbi:DUF349 domain-containing protein [Comamonas sp. GB3 AK4-5]|uniref:DUF349 domain-containing protein n=1 Tax=Comamonas sp. GB3 AK4-5 TaxID=3231487 RepID=UPI00351F32F3